jgi:hypothetical protein
MIIRLPNRRLALYLDRENIWGSINVHPGVMPELLYWNEWARTVEDAREIVGEALTIGQSPEWEPGFDYWVDQIWRSPEVARRFCAFDPSFIARGRGIVPAQHKLEWAGAELGHWESRRGARI